MCLCTAKRTRDVAVLLLTLTGLNQPYAPEQLELLRSPPNNSTTDTLAKRGTNDLFFKSHTWVNCLTPDACTPPFFNLEGGICDRSSCENYQVQRFAWNSNPCHKTFNVPGTSYFVDNCDPNADWSVMPLSSREKGVLKVNGVCRGGCFAINYTYENGNCIKVSFGDAWNRITFCINA